MNLIVKASLNNKSPLFTSSRHEEERMSNWVTMPSLSMLTRGCSDKEHINYISKHASTDEPSRFVAETLYAGLIGRHGAHFPC